MVKKDEGYNDPLEWWRVLADKYPNIWKIASCILPIPATSAPSERVFSAAANLVNKKRACLKPETADLLLLLRERGFSQFHVLRANKAAAMHQLF
jgi:hypothetical protein